MSSYEKPLRVSSKYYIDPDRYTELKAFCAQYPKWIAASSALLGIQNTQATQEVFTKVNNIMNPVERAVIARESFESKIRLIDDVIKMLDISEEVRNYLLSGVTQKFTWDYMQYDYILPVIPIARNAYYKLYRQFFWTLDREMEKRISYI